MDLLKTLVENQSELRNKMPENTIAINEIFYSIQGEGKHVGLPMVFIRTNFCMVGCRFCDTKYTWEKITHNKFMTPQDVYKEVQRIAPKCKHVCFSGGEPFEQEEMLYQTCKYLTSQKIKVHIETSGSCIIPEKFSDVVYWIVCSPKRFNRLNFDVGVINEIKILVTAKANIEKLRSWVSNFKYRIWVTLQPIEPTPYEYGNFTNMEQDDIDIMKKLIETRKKEEELEWFENRKHAVDLCKQTGWALSLQMHKYLNIR